ncbi:aminodeoxychorismate/anthranilate synthase component II [Bacillus sp. MUM 13]|uniref:anthranilate synthase component II n=1 Tax=Bacillus sp. MUM 13 TaxID=1678001 RepID=UPI0008F5BE93|nr:aminodeoxychorismate/anthranilate synthase component II [Bacillus sp. MUM 13]OIK09049.1 aminodeoxychorismate/anthranilate synthase component II [Bacillus sp. MUM 13]
MILLIDNYDSFTFNLFQYLGEFEPDILVRRNDCITLNEIEALKPQAIVISPGPGRPENAGICIELIQHFHKKIPILGICLGHQAIGAAFGARIVEAKRIVHGKASFIKHDGTDLFEQQDTNVSVMRYHSLVIDEKCMPAELTVTANAADDGEIMAIRHVDFPVFGLQFHPESIGTKTGKSMLHKFIMQAREENHFETVS